MFADKWAYLERAARLAAGRDRRRGGIACRRSLPPDEMLAALKEWWEPLLRRGRIFRDGVGGPVRYTIGELDMVVDFPKAKVREYAGEETSYWFTIPADLVSTNIRDREIDWSNSIFLSMQFEAGRVGKFNEFIYTFMKCLSRDRIEYVENWYAEQSDVSEDVQLGRLGACSAAARTCAPTCPRPRKIEDGVLTCSLHDWKWDLDVSGKCLSTQGHPIRSPRSRTTWLRKRRLPPPSEPRGHGQRWTRMPIISVRSARRSVSRSIAPARTEQPARRSAAAIWRATTYSSRAITGRADSREAWRPPSCDDGTERASIAVADAHRDVARSPTTSTAMHAAERPSTHDRVARDPPTVGAHDRRHDGGRDIATSTTIIASVSRSRARVDCARCVRVSTRRSERTSEVQPATRTMRAVQRHERGDDADQTRSPWSGRRLRRSARTLIATSAAVVASTASASAKRRRRSALPSGQYEAAELDACRRARRHRRRATATAAAATARRDGARRTRHPCRPVGGHCGDRGTPRGRLCRTARARGARASASSTPERPRQRSAAL